MVHSRIGQTTGEKIKFKSRILGKKIKSLILRILKIGNQI